MITRRNFITMIGAASGMPTIKPLLGPGPDDEPTRAPMHRPSISLNGEWERRIDGVLYDIVQIPSSQRPLGFYHLRPKFLLPRLSGHERAILHFDAITYYGQVWVNGKLIGAMGPYVPYEFDFTAMLKEGANEVEVGIADLSPAPDGGGKLELELGVNIGWEAYGGIIRDVYVEVRPTVFVENLQFGYALDRNFERAECTALVFISSKSAGTGRLEVTLRSGGAVLVKREQRVDIHDGVKTVEVKFTVDAPALWSPEAPNRYELSASLHTDAGTDQWSTMTGFRDVKIEGNRFLLNGERLVLKGVCRHDMWKDVGFTLTAAQMEQDMRMIKELGCNYVRLVHYPHHRRIIELADELGMLVSEESGYWGMDFKTMPPKMIELGYEIMERTIRRDWNSPSVFAWLLGNECNLTVEYLREGKERCRKLDPLRRPVSFANSMPMEQAKPIYEQAGIDFFDQHIYTFNPDDFTHAIQFYGAQRPITFTEWGGRAIGQSNILMDESIDRLHSLTIANALAGHSFWSWQDMREYTRIDAEMHDGVLESGVVTESRAPRLVPYMGLAKLLETPSTSEKPARSAPRVLPLKRTPWSRKGDFISLDLQPLVDGSNGKRSWHAFEGRMAAFWSKYPMGGNQWQRTGEKFLLWHEPEIMVGGVTFQMPVGEGSVRPLMLTPDVPEAAIPIEQNSTRLHILGQVTFPQGYPVVSQNGEPIAVYHLLYTDGQKEEVPIRSGFEAAQANRIYEATRINPVAIAAQPALHYVKDIAREHYQVLLLTIPVNHQSLKSLRLSLLSKQLCLAVFAVTAETAAR